MCSTNYKDGFCIACGFYKGVSSKGGKFLLPAFLKSSLEIVLGFREDDSSSTFYPSITTPHVSTWGSIRKRFFEIVAGISEMGFTKCQHKTGGNVVQLLN